MIVSVIYRTKILVFKIAWRIFSVMFFFQRFKDETVPNIRESVGFAFGVEPARISTCVQFPELKK